MASLYYELGLDIDSFNVHPPLTQNPFPQPRDGGDLSQLSAKEQPKLPVPKALPSGGALESIEATSGSYPKSKLQLEGHCIDDVGRLRVAVIGAGIAGVLAGTLLPPKVPNIALTIYEKNHDVGGTWLENVYPGVRCDIPAHVYQASFSPKTQWSEQFAQGAEIRDYWQALARKYNVYRYIKFGSKIQDARWEEDKSVWVLTILDMKSGTIHQEQTDFVLMAIGKFNAWKLPDYPGISDYRGLLRHTSNWDSSFEPAGKNVAVIGNGASGIQVVPNLQKVAHRVDHYARNKTWIAGSWAGDVRTFDPQHFPREQLESFKDPKQYLAFRKQLEEKYWRRFRGVLRGSNENDNLRQDFVQIMQKRLHKKPELLNSLVPEFSPHCRRLTPGPGYLEAITEDNVVFIQTPIKRFTETGIETVDGMRRDVDAIFCATGANVDTAPPFSVVSRGVDLKTAWKLDGDFGFPYTYLGLATPGFPNLLYVYGPHGAGASGTVPHGIEVQLTYYAKLLRKVSSQGIKTMTPSKKAADDFIEYSDAFFPTTVFTDSCSSWYNGGKAGSRIHGLWPGSAAHVTIIRREPRWEDWEYEYHTTTGNRFAYFGNGWTRKEVQPDHDMTTYLKLPSEIDLRDLHESWWDLP